MLDNSPELWQEQNAPNKWFQLWILIPQHDANEKFPNSLFNMKLKIYLQIHKKPSCVAVTDYWLFLKAVQISLSSSQTNRFSSTQKIKVFWWKHAADWLNETQVSESISVMNYGSPLSLSLACGSVDPHSKLMLGASPRRRPSWLKIELRWRMHIMQPGLRWSPQTGHAAAPVAANGKGWQGFTPKSPISYFLSLLCSSRRR